MSFGKGLLYEGQPSLILCATLRKIQCTGIGLVCFAIFLFCILSIEDLIPVPLFISALIIVGYAEIQLVVNNGLNPFSI